MESGQFWEKCPEKCFLIVVGSVKILFVLQSRLGFSGNGRIEHNARISEAFWTLNWWGGFEFLTESSLKVPYSSKNSRLSPTPNKNLNQSLIALFFSSFYLLQKTLNNWGHQLTQLFLEQNYSLIKILRIFISYFPFLNVSCYFILKNQPLKLLWNPRRRRKKTADVT